MDVCLYVDGHMCFLYFWRMNGCEFFYLPICPWTVIKNVSDLNVPTYLHFVFNDKPHSAAPYPYASASLQYVRTYTYLPRFHVANCRNNNIL